MYLLTQSTFNQLQPFEFRANGNGFKRFALKYTKEAVSFRFLKFCC